MKFRITMGENSVFVLQHNSERRNDQTGYVVFFIYYLLYRIPLEEDVTIMPYFCSRFWYGLLAPTIYGQPSRQPCKGT